MAERLDTMPDVVQEYSVYNTPENGRQTAQPKEPSKPDIKKPIELTPPKGWLIDRDSIQNDEKLRIMESAGYIAVTPVMQPKRNRGIINAVESGVNTYYEYFVREEVVFLWNANKGKRGVQQQISNPTLRPNISSRFNGRLETFDGTILPVLKTKIGWDANEYSEEPMRIINKTYLNEPGLSEKQIKLLDMGHNYLGIISEMKDNGTFPEEWDWDHKIAEWENQQARTKEVTQQVSQKDPLEYFKLRSEQAEQVKVQKYPSPKVSSVAELLEHYPEYRQDMPIPVSVYVSIPEKSEI